MHFPVGSKCNYSKWIETYAAELHSTRKIHRTHYAIQTHTKLGYWTCKMHLYCFYSERSFFSSIRDWSWFEICHRTHFTWRIYAKPMSVLIVMRIYPLYIWMDWNMCQTLRTQHDWKWNGERKNGWWKKHGETTKVHFYCVICKRKKKANPIALFYFRAL